MRFDKRIALLVVVALSVLLGSLPVQAPYHTTTTTTTSYETTTTSTTSTTTTAASTTTTTTTTLPYGGGYETTTTTTSSTGGATIQLTSAPASAAPGEKLSFVFQITGTGSISHTSVHWDTKPCSGPLCAPTDQYPTGYPNLVEQYASISPPDEAPKTYTLTFNSPDQPSTIYYRIHAVVNGNHLYPAGGEGTITIEAPTTTTTSAGAAPGIDPLLIGGVAAIVVVAALAAVMLRRR